MTRITGGLSITGGLRIRKPQQIIFSSNRIQYLTGTNLGVYGFNTQSNTQVNWNSGNVNAIYWNTGGSLVYFSNDTSFYNSWGGVSGVYPVTLGSGSWIDGVLNTTTGNYIKLQSTDPVNSGYTISLCSDAAGIIPASGIAVLPFVIFLPVSS